MQSLWVSATAEQMGSSSAETKSDKFRNSCLQRI